MTIDIQGHPVILDPEIAELFHEENPRKFLLRVSNSTTSKRYAYFRLDGQKQFLHHFVLGYKGNKDVDHINGNSLDNRRENLRIATRSQNIANGKMSARNKSGYRGVCWDRKAGKWRAQITVLGHVRCLGRFNDPARAAQAYDSEALKAFGEFATLNNP